MDTNQRLDATNPATPEAGAGDEAMRIAIEIDMHLYREITGDQSSEGYVAGPAALAYAGIIQRALSARDARIRELSGLCAAYPRQERIHLEELKRLEAELASLRLRVAELKIALRLAIQGGKGIARHICWMALDDVGSDSPYDQCRKAQDQLRLAEETMLKAAIGQAGTVDGNPGPSQ